jgi:hypothetical protein
MLRVALGRARPETEWSTRGSRVGGGFKVSALEFASNSGMTEAAIEDEDPRDKEGKDDDEQCE